MNGDIIVDGGRDRFVYLLEKVSATRGSWIDGEDELEESMKSEVD